MAKLAREHHDDVYRPGEDVAQYADLSDDEQRAYFDEIERAFQDDKLVVVPDEEE